VPSATFEHTLKENVPRGRPVLAAALARMGLSPDQVAVLSAACHLDESAMAVVSVIDHGIKNHFHPDVISVIDSEFGRITISHTAGPDGTRWTSVWPTSSDGLRQDIAKLLNSSKAPAAAAMR
jgi:EspG family